VQAGPAISIGLRRLVVLALHEEVAPIGSELTALNTGAARGQRARVDKLVKVNSQLGKVSKRQCGAAYPGRALCVDVRVEHRLAREPGMKVPLLVMIGPRRQPTNKRQLLAWGVSKAVEKKPARWIIADLNANMMPMFPNTPRRPRPVGS
jgi:hypothetical protein